MRTPPHRRFPRAGQAVVLLLAVLVVLVSMALWVTDIRGLSLRRLRIRDGGDAAALAAARWQAAGLNLIGELNLIQAYMLADDVWNAEAADALHELRQRIQLTAPFLGLLSAQTLAERNGLEELPEAADILRDVTQEAVFRDFYPEAEEDFRKMGDIVFSRPLRAYPCSPLHENSEFPNLLVTQDFYEAILADDWCWFWFYAYAFLQHYSNHRDFGAVPDLSTEPFFGLSLGALETSLDELVRAEGTERAIDGQLRDLGRPPLPPPPEEPGDGEPPQPPHVERPRVIRWSVYDSARWTRWDLLDDLPMDGDVRDQYDYFGASATVSVSLDGADWLSSAKAFGALADGRTPNAVSLVLGGFDDVRLIPVDAAEGGNTAFNAKWLRHLRDHVPEYARHGAYTPGCRYCSALRTFDNHVWRARALAWLELHGHTCRRPKTGNHSNSGGTHFAH